MQHHTIKLLDGRYIFVYRIEETTNTTLLLNCGLHYERIDKTQIKEIITHNENYDTIEFYQNGKVKGVRYERK